MASQKDIAQALDVSVTLVSCVLSGRMGTVGCSEDLRKAILDKADELGYSINPLAQALRAGRTGAIGVFIHPTGAPGSDLIARLLMGLSTQANVHGQRLCLSFYENDSEFLGRFSKTVRNDVDGLLVAGVSHPEMDTIYNEIEQNGTPVVSMFAHTSDQIGSPNIYCDKFQLGYMPVRHLVDKGCRKIAHIRVSEHLYQAYLHVLNEFGLPADPSLVFEAPKGFTHGAAVGREAVRSWLDSGVEFDGLAAESDQQAFGAITELDRLGKRVPEDVKVIGVDNSAICESSPVRISSISQQYEEIGARAVDAILKRINKEPLEPVDIQPKLFLRASTGD